MQNSSRFVKVPVWAPRKGKYTTLAKPIERWLLHLIAAHRDMKNESQNEDLIAAFADDEDLLRLCLMVNDLREVNLAICDGTILLASGEEYVTDLPVDVSTRIENLKHRVEIADSQSPLAKKDIFNNESDGYIAIVLKTWKQDQEFHASMPTFFELTNRLTSFLEKNFKIDFNSSALVAYNKTLAQNRIDLDSICIQFLNVFLPFTTNDENGNDKE